MAALAEQRQNQPKSRLEMEHEQLGARMFEQEKEHANLEREFKLESDRPAAKKLSYRVDVQKLPESKPEVEPEKVTMTTSQPEPQSKNFRTNQATANSNKSDDENQKEDFTPKKSQSNEKPFRTNQATVNSNKSEEEKESL